MSRNHPFAHFTPLQQAGITLEAIRHFHWNALPPAMRMEVERVCLLIEQELRARQNPIALGGDGAAGSSPSAESLAAQGEQHDH